MEKTYQGNKKTSYKKKENNDCYFGVHITQLC